MARTLGEILSRTGKRKRTSKSGTTKAEARIRLSTTDGAGSSDDELFSDAESDLPTTSKKRHTTNCDKFVDVITLYNRDYPLLQKSMEPSVVSKRLEGATLAAASLTEQTGKSWTSKELLKKLSSMKSTVKKR